MTHYVAPVLNQSKWNQQIWRPEVRFSNLFPGSVSNIPTKPLSSDRDTIEGNIKSFHLPISGNAKPLLVDTTALLPSVAAQPSL